VVGADRATPDTERRVIEANRVFVLDDPTKMLSILAGAAEVLISRVMGGVPVGTRWRLGRVTQGDAVFPAVDDDRGEEVRLALLSTEEMKILILPVDRWDQACPGANDRPGALVHKWVDEVSGFFSANRAPGGADRATEAGPRVVDCGRAIRAERSRAVWVRVDAGIATFVGLPDCTIEPGPALLPLTEILWLKAEQQLSVTVVKPSEVSSARNLIDGLSLLHRFLLRRARALAAEQERHEVQRLEERDAVQRRRTRSALGTLASALDETAPVQLRESALENALVLVAGSLGLEVAAMPRSAVGRSPHELLDTLTRASRLRYRRVLLRGAWWKSDSGPLVGFLKDGGQPVALLPADASGYVLVDPQTADRVRLDKSTASHLIPDAVMVYPRLPDGLSQPLQLVRFLLRGKGTDILLVIVLALLGTAFGMLTPLVTAVVMDTAIPGADRQLLIELGLILLAAALGGAGFDLAQGILSIRMAVSSEAIAQATLWDRLLSLRVSFFSRYTTGDLLSRVSSASDISRQLNGATVQSLLAALMSLLNLGLMAYFSLRLAIMACALAMAVGACTLVGGHYIRRYSRLLLELRGEFFGLVVQMINAVNKIRVAGAQQRAFATWAARYAKQLGLVRRAHAVEDYLVVLNQVLPALSTIVLFWMAAGLMSDGRRGASADISIGVFLAFYAAMGTFLAGVTALSLTAVDLLEAAAKAKRIHPLLEAEQEVDESKVDPGPLAGGITLDHVDFRYIEGGRKILDNVSLRADPTEFIALAGPSGSGKSTILRLLLGFESPESGMVAFDGQDLTSLDTAAVRRQIGVVLQSGRITAGSIIDNICVGATVTLEEAWEAVEDAGLADDIRAMPMGLHTVVSEGGTNFSGGQRQRLLIARALVARPRILLMDEATSALDNRTQSIVSESLKRRRVTRLVVAHRLSTIRHADRVYVLRRGVVVETGGYAELVAANGLFAALMARQIA